MNTTTTNQPTSVVLQALELSRERYEIINQNRMDSEAVQLMEILENLGVEPGSIVVRQYYRNTFILGMPGDAGRYNEIEIRIKEGWGRIDEVGVKFDSWKVQMPGRDVCTSEDLEIEAVHLAGFIIAKEVFNPHGPLEMFLVKCFEADVAHKALVAPLRKAAHIETKRVKEEQLLAELIEKEKEQETYRDEVVGELYEVGKTWSFSRQSNFSRNSTIKVTKVTEKRVYFSQAWSNRWDDNNYFISKEAFEAEVYGKLAFPSSALIDREELEKDYWTNLAADAGPYGEII